MKKIIIALLILAVLVLSGCKSSVTGGTIICNKPYILVGTDCCLDKDDNAVCDRDEEETPVEEIEQKEEPKEEIIEQPEIVEEIKEEITETLGEYVMKEGDTVTFEGKQIIVNKVGFFQGRLAVTVTVDGTERELYDTKNPEIINWLKVQVLKYEQLKNSITLKVEKFELGANEYLIDTRTVLTKPGKPEIRIINVLDDGAILFDVEQGANLDSKINLDEGETTTVQGVTITNIDGFPRTISGIKLEKYAIIKVEW